LEDALQKKPSLGMLIWNRRLNKVDGGCLHDLRRADLQGSEEDAQQKVVDGTCFIRCSSFDYLQSLQQEE